jgi:diguanylate cyclase
VKDVLTDLCNRRYFEKVLKRQVRKARVTGRPLSLMMIDVDYFKQINDAMGHGVGDEVLKAVSNALLRSIRRFDVCCRYGGDEFVVVLPGTAAVQAAAVAERMRGAVSSLQLSSNGQPFGVTLSIGIAEHSAHMTAEALKAQADHAMYGSKNAGKNRVTVTCAQSI